MKPEGLEVKPEINPEVKTEEKPEEKSKVEPVTELPGIFPAIPIELKKIQRSPRIIPEKKPEEPKVDPNKIEEILKKADEAKGTADAAKIGVKELDDRLKKIEDDFQKQINETRKMADGSIPLWMIGAADLVLALAAAYYSSDYDFNPVRANIAAALCAILSVMGIALYLWRRSKASKNQNKPKQTN